MRILALLAQPLLIPDQSWKEVTMDFIEGLPKSGGRTTSLVVVDRLTKFANFLSLTHPFTAKTVPAVLIESVYKLYGLPRVIISDKVNFGESFGHASKLHLSTAYHPQSDGQSELENRCLETYLRCFCSHKPQD